MRTGLWSNVVVAIAAASLAGAVGAKPAGPPPPPPDGTLIGGCDSSLTTPEAVRSGPCDRSFLPVHDLETSSERVG